MLSEVVCVIVPVVVILTVSEVSRGVPRVGALLLSLPLVSVLACCMSWYRDPVSVDYVVPLPSIAAPC